LFENGGDVLAHLNGFVFSFGFYEFSNSGNMKDGNVSDCMGFL